MNVNELKWAAIKALIPLTPDASLQEFEHEYLTFKGVAPGGHLNERWYKLFPAPSGLSWNENAHGFLNLQGVPVGPLPSRWYAFWLAGG